MSDRIRRKQILMLLQPFRFLQHSIILTHLDEVIHGYHVVISLYGTPQCLLVFCHILFFFLHIRQTLLRITPIVVKLLTHRKHQTNRHHVHICHSTQQVIVRRFQHLPVAHLSRIILHLHAIDISPIQHCLMKSVSIRRISILSQYFIHITSSFLKRAILRLRSQHIERVNLTLLCIHSFSTRHQAKEHCLCHDEE